MPRRPMSLRVRDAGMQSRLCAGFAQIRAELGLPDGFPSEVLAEAERAAGQWSFDDSRADGPAGGGEPRVDLTEVPFLTIDPPGSTDLDQALHLQRRNAGFRVRYAIADVGSFVRPGGPVDKEAHTRRTTFYSPDTRTPLHPPVLSEGSASLLPDEVRPAVVWTIELDADGECTSVDVRRAVIRSRDRLDYAGVQAALDGGQADERLKLLRAVGQRRQEAERRRGGVNLPIPEQEVVQVDGAFRLAYRLPLPVEGWNAQISLLTGMAAADVMLGGGIGVLRTLPGAPAEKVAVLRRTAVALGIEWTADRSYSDVIADLDAANPRHAAFLEEATALLRGAGYTAFDGEVPAQAMHAALAAEYAHATAPLRRLVDRYVSEVCLALCAGADVPEWVRAALPALPQEMADADRLAGALERECVALTEAVVLEEAVGEAFDAVVVEVRPGGGTVQLSEPAVRASFEGELPLAEPVRVRLAEADVRRRRVLFRPA